MEAGGNRLAGEAAKQACLEEEIRFLSLIPSIPKVTLNLQFTIEEEEELDKIGTIKAEDGRWVLPDGREIISKPMIRDLMLILHRRSH